LDTAGQERYRSVIPLYLRDAAVLLIVCSVDIDQSFQNLADWLWIAEGCMDISGKVVIVAAKSDLIDSQDTIVGSIQAFARDRGFLSATTSSLTGEGVNALLERIARMIQSQAATPAQAKAEVAVKEVPERRCC
jgi:GTPase SAR1 family protein